LDAAVARIDGVDLQSLRPLAKTPRIPDPGTRVMKVGRHITVGTVLCRCPVAKIGNCDDPLKKSEHSDLLMIESIPGEDPFLAGSDSGSLVTTEDGTPVGIATAANTESLESGSSETPCGLVTLITAIMPEMERILKDLSPPPLKISLKV